MLRGTASGHLKTVPSAQLNLHSARVRRTHGRPPPNGFIERARKSLLPFTTPRDRTSDKVLGLKPAGRGSLLTACGYTHIHGNLTGVCGLGGAFQQKEGEIGGQGLGTQPPNHRSDLATMIRGVVGQMLHEVR